MRELENFCVKCIYNNCDHAKIYSKNSNLSDVLYALIDSDKSCDCPDGCLYDKENDILYVFEHFEFDCSPNNKDGSYLRKESAFVGKQTKKEIAKIESEQYSSTKIISQIPGTKSEDTVTYSIGENGDLFRNNYINNFEKEFNKHANRINDYILNCLSRLNLTCKNIKVVFVIEDATMFGAYFKDNESMGNEVNLFLTKQFVDVFIDSSIDYAVFAMRDCPQTLSVCDKTFLDIKAYNIIDLYEHEFFIIPVALKHTTAIKQKS